MGAVWEFAQRLHQNFTTELTQDTHISQYCILNFISKITFYILYICKLAILYPMHVRFHNELFFNLGIPTSPSYLEVIDICKQG